MLTGSVDWGEGGRKGKAPRPPAARSWSPTSPASRLSRRIFPGETCFSPASAPRLPHLTAEKSPSSAGHSPFEPQASWLTRPALTHKYRLSSLCRGCCGCVCAGCSGCGRTAHTADTGTASTPDRGSSSCGTHNSPDQEPTPGTPGTSSQCSSAGAWPRPCDGPQACPSGSKAGSCPEQPRSWLGARWELESRGGLRTCPMKTGGLTARPRFGEHRGCS